MLHALVGLFSKQPPEYKSFGHQSSHWEKTLAWAAISTIHARSVSDVNIIYSFLICLKKCKHISCVWREDRVLSPARVSSYLLLSWSGEPSLLCFTPTWTGQAPEFVVLHFPSPFSPLKSRVISYQQKCEPCQGVLWLPACSPCSTELRSRFSLSSSSFTSCARGPHPQHSDHFSFMSASSETVCKRMSQPLPCQCPGTTLLKAALIFQEYGGALACGRSHLGFPPAGICRPDFHPQRTHTLVIEL